MSRTIRRYNKWAKRYPLYPWVSDGWHARWWKQWSYGNPCNCYRRRNAKSMTRINNKRKRILIKKRKFEMI